MQQLANNEKCFSSFLLPPWYVMLAQLAGAKGAICLLAECVRMGSLHSLWSLLYELVASHHTQGKENSTMCLILGSKSWKKKNYLRCFLLIRLYKNFSLNVLCRAFEVWGGLTCWSWGCVLAQAGSLVLNFSPLLSFTQILRVIVT